MIDLTQFEKEAGMVFVKKNVRDHLCIGVVSSSNLDGVKVVVSIHIF